MLIICCQHRRLLLLNLLIMQYLNQRQCLYKPLFNLPPH